MKVPKMIVLIARCRMRGLPTLLLVGCSAWAYAQTISKTPSNSASAPTPSLARSVVIQDIASLIAESGSESEISGELAGVLALDDGTNPWLYYSVGARADESDPSSSLHVFAVDRGNRPRVLFFRSTRGDLLYVGAERDGTPVSAISSDGGGKLSRVAPDEAQREVDAELIFWQNNLERTRQWSRCMGELAGAHPTTPEKKIEGCNWLIQSGKEAKRAVSMAYTGRSQAYPGTEKQKKLDDLEKAVEIDPTFASAWAQLCSVQNWIAKDAKAALQSCSKAIELDSQSSEAWTYRGDIHLRNKEFDDAIADYDHALKLTPDWMWPWDNRGEAYLRKGDIDRSIQDFNEVIRLNPDYAMGFLDRGIAEMRKKDLDSARADFETGLKVDSKCASCLFGRGLVKTAKGDPDGGNADMAKARTLVPDPSEAFTNDGIPIP